MQKNSSFSIFLILYRVCESQQNVLHVRLPRERTKCDTFPLNLMRVHNVARIRVHDRYLLDLLFWERPDLAFLCVQQIRATFPRILAPSMQYGTRINFSCIDQSRAALSNYVTSHHVSHLSLICYIRLNFFFNFELRM